MKSLMITSTKSRAGKTTFGLGLLLNFSGSFGYFKPLANNLSEEGYDKDILLFKRILGLEEEPQEMFVAKLDSSGVHWRLRSKLNKFKDKDLVLIESAHNLSYGAFLRLCSACVSKILKNKALIVAEGDLENIVDKSLLGKAYFSSVGSEVLGVVINKVPLSNLEEVEDIVIPALENSGLEVFGVIPEKKILSFLKVKDLLEELDAELLGGESGLSREIETTVLGAMALDSALKYFRKYMRKVVITGGDRSDIQLGALETSTSCLVLTGNLHPSPPVLAKAQELKVPVLLVEDDTYSAFQKVERVRSEIKPEDLKKIKTIEKMVASHVDLDGILEGI